jgi:endoglucanase
MKRTILHGMLGALFLVPTTTSAQIRLNQVGMYPNQEKTAVIEGTVKAGQVKITNTQNGKTDVKVKVLRTAVSPWSKKKRTVVDFSQLTAPGEYTIRCGKESVTFTIGNQALRDLTKGTLRYFYLNRSGMPIEAKYAGPYARPMGHPDTLVYIHPSAASLGRPAGSTISSPYGWYDAGDYNKYIVNSAFSVGLMLCSYEQNKEYYDRLDVNIPESGNKTADLLDELYYNLRWMLTMQDPYDGGVYHKLTTPNFEAFVMPVDCHQKRYVVQKSTAATLDFAAVMAQAARIFKSTKDYACFADQAARAAIAAWGWAERNPRVLYRQQQMNHQYQPAVSTGEYGDGSVNDEWFWAATELYLLTSDKQFEEQAAKYQPTRFTAPTWGMVASLGAYDWMTLLPETPIANSSRQQLLHHCDSILSTTATSSFQSPNGNSPRDFGWGCLSETFGTNGLSLLYAHRLTKDTKYLKGALQDVEYMLGRNATGYCYVTGFGTKSPMHPHHRLSESDGIEAPYPGMLVGGPNPGQQDIADVKVYASKQPDESYNDVMQSYASNEIAINWNASLLALLGWICCVME